MDFLDTAQRGRKKWRIKDNKWDITSISAEMDVKIYNKCFFKAMGNGNKIDNERKERYNISNATFFKMEVSCFSLRYVFLIRTSVCSWTMHRKMVGKGTKRARARFCRFLSRKPAKRTGIHFGKGYTELRGIGAPTA
jgi:hypothetical protein